jgi:hypothetical protein
LVAELAEALDGEAPLEAEALLDDGGVSLAGVAGEGVEGGGTAEGGGGVRLHAARPSNARNDSNTSERFIGYLRAGDTNVGSGSRPRTGQRMP